MRGLTVAQCEAGQGQSFQEPTLSWALTGRVSNYGYMDYAGFERNAKEGGDETIILAMKRAVKDLEEGAVECM